ncbi:2-aminoethylphosphonate ABC transporter permease subunit [Streptomyces kasugaensis]|uniref:2-aminoethylphosphonate ABC transporter permease subunit n=1 Tax=Streptomyces kasugaensis TaxID=1946 RepID=A0A4Q9HLN9_STRKA|nr:2-aminoethylphosphonate ABC transporter permease subunit [Streptomyces kasugaensis]TBO55668.1 2-aminoethylphosphonate ABC transporter permease subunit [Streptomyces kasugaensis]
MPRTDTAVRADRVDAAGVADTAARTVPDPDPGPPAPTKRRPAGRSKAGWVLPPVAALGLVFLYPLALVVWQSFTPEDGGHSTAPYAAVLAEASFRDALANTVLIAVGATAGALALGLVLALVIAFVPFPGGRALSRFIDIFLAFPSFLITLALLFLYGTAGMANGLWTDVTGAASGPLDFLRTPWGVLLAEITYFTPFVMRPLLAAFSQVETGQLEAAAALGARPWRIIRKVILPEALPSLAAGGALVLVLCLNEFGIVLFTGAKDVVTLPMLVYTKAILDGDYTGACVVAVVNIALSVALYALYRTVVARTAPRSGSRTGGVRRRVGA